MDIFSTSAPAYKTATKLATTHVAHAQPALSSGLSSLLGSLFGNATPAYKSADGARVSASASSGFLGSLLSVAAPSYKAASAMAQQADEPAELAADMDAGVIVITPSADEDPCGCPPTSDEVVLL